MRLSPRWIAAILLAASAAACTDTRTINTPIPAGKVAGRLSLNPVFSPAAKTISASLADFGITFDHVRVRIRTLDTATVVLDTTVAFTSTSSDLVLDLTVPVNQVGESFNALVEYLSGTQPIFAGTVELQSFAPDQSPPDQRALTLTFVGPGAKLKTISVTPKPVNLVGSQTVSLTISATDSSGAALAVPPLVFTSSDESVAKVVTSGSTRSVQSFGKRGQAIIVATTPIGISDTLSALVTLPPAAIVLVSGGGQSGTVATALANPAVVQVNASDGIGVANAAVVFAAPTGGSVGTATVNTDANGRASTTLTLSGTAGAQSFSASAAGFSVAIPETGTPGAIAAAQSLISATSPILADNKASSVITIQARDQFQNVIKTGGATISLTTSLGHFGTGTATTTTATDNKDGTYTAALFSSIGGTATVTASIGATQFASPATVTLVAGTLDHFDVTKTDGTAIGPTVTAGTPIAVKITARDAGGNVVPSYTGQPVVRVTHSFLTPDTVVTAPAAVSGVSNVNVTLGSAGQAVTLDVTGTLGDRTVVSHSAAFTVVGGAAGKLTTPDTASVVLDEFDTTPTHYPVVLVKDASGNPVANQTVNFQVASIDARSGSPACTVPTPTATSDAQGAITFSANSFQFANGADGPYSCVLIATATVNGQQLTPLLVPIVVRSSSMSTWTGKGHDGKWTTVDNWDPSAPSSSSSVFLPLATTALSLFPPPQLTSSVGIFSIEVEDGGQLLLNNFNLSVNGNVNAHVVGSIGGGTITASGGGILGGQLSNLTCAGGEYSVTANLLNSGTFTNSGCQMFFNGSSMVVTGNFTQNGNGTIAMGNPNDQLDISGDAIFAGGSESDLLSNGVITARGSLSQSGTTATAFATSLLQHTQLTTARTTDRTLSMSSPSSVFTYLDLVVTPSSSISIPNMIEVDSALSIVAQNGGSLSLPNGMVNRTNGTITITAQNLTMNLGGLINARDLTFNAGSVVTLNGGGNLILGNGVITFKAGSQTTVNLTGTATAHDCIKETGAQILGNSAAAMALNAACHP